MTLGQRIKRARTVAGFHDLRPLARAIKDHDPDVAGADHTSIGKYERDATQPKAQWLAAFCAVTNANANYLLRNEGPVQRTDPRQESMLADELEELLRKVKRPPEADE